MNDELVGLILSLVQTLQARVERRVFLVITKCVNLPEYVHASDLLDMVEKDFRAFHQRVELKFRPVLQVLARESETGQVFNTCRFRPLGDAKYPHRSPNIDYGERNAVSGAPPPMPVRQNDDMIGNLHFFLPICACARKTKCL